MLLAVSTVPGAFTVSAEGIDVLLVVHTRPNIRVTNVMTSEVDPFQVSQTFIRSYFDVLPTAWKSIPDICPCEGDEERGDSPQLYVLVWDDNWFLASFPEDGEVGCAELLQRLVTPGIDLVYIRPRIVERRRNRGRYLRSRYLCPFMLPEECQDNIWGGIAELNHTFTVVKQIRERYSREEIDAWHQERLKVTQENDDWIVTFIEALCAGLRVSPIVFCGSLLTGQAQYGPTEILERIGNPDAPPLLDR